MSTGEIDSNHSTPAHCLRLPGRILDLKALLKKKKFQEPHGYKKGAVAAFSELEIAELGAVETKRSKFGIVSIFTTAFSFPLFMPVLFIGIPFREGSHSRIPRRESSFCKKIEQIQHISSGILTGYAAGGDTVRLHTLSRVHVTCLKSFICLFCDCSARIKDL